MSLVISWVKKELARLGMQKNRKFLISHQRRRLTHSKSLSASQLGEVVVAADLCCQECQERVSGILSQIDDVEAMVFHVFEKKVTVIRKSTAEGSLFADEEEE